MKIKRPILFIATVLMSVFVALSARASGKAKHVIVIVWDGMRPDFVSEQNTPTLSRLIREGVWFENHHPVYMSATEVNGTAISTGAYPAHSGLIANREYLPNIYPDKTFHTEEIDAVRKGDLVTHGHYLRVPTIAEWLQKKGMKTVIAGAKPVALLHDRSVRSISSRGVNLFAGETLPPDLLPGILSLYGSFPATNSVDVTRNDWTTSALLNPLWRDGVPPFSILWMNEPDAAQHATGPGSVKSLAAIRNADDNLARVLAALEAKGLRDQTDVLVVSDHGFSTVLSVVDLADSLNDAGFKAVREFKTKPENGDVMVAGNGGSALLYVAGHDQKVVVRLVEFLQNWNYTGVIFTRTAMPGTFTLEQGHLDSSDAPDIMMAMRWNPERNDAGTPGMLVCDLCPFQPGQGMHGSLSPYEMHNTFAAAGPDFRAGIVDHLPTGNVDIAPTVLWILGVKPPGTMDGRVISEALTSPAAKMRSFEPNHLEASRELGKITWHQYLNYTEVNGVVYFDEGNGFQTRR